MTKILLIEDEPVLNRELKRVLEFEGYEVTPAEDAARGLAAVKGGDFELVLTDLKLPGASGMDVVRKVNHSAAGGQKLTPPVQILNVEVKK